MDLVPADADQVGTEAFRREGDFQKGLHRVGVQQRRGTGLTQQGGNGGKVRDGAGLVVDKHQRDEDGVLAQRAAHRVRRHGAAAVGFQLCYLKAALLQQVQATADGIVLGFRADDVAAFPPAVLGPGKQRPVVALRAAGGKHQIMRLTAQRPCHGGTGAVQKLFGLAADGMGRTRIAETDGHGLQCGLCGFRADPGGSGIVKIVHGVSFCAEG